jgi:hypothetical protein
MGLYVEERAFEKKKFGGAGSYGEELHGLDGSGQSLRKDCARANASKDSKQLEDIIVVPRSFKKLASKACL